MRLVTWNVNSLAARLDFVLDFLAVESPDIVCVQELKLSDDAFPHAALEAAGYRALTHGQNQWNGVAVLLRATVDPAAAIVTAGLPGKEALGARLITVRAAGLNVTSVYVPNGKTLEHPDYQAKVSWLEALVHHVETTFDRSAPTVIAGDFNVVPADIDSWDPVAHAGGIFHTEAERTPLARLAALGFHDLFRSHHPELQAFTFWDYRAGSFHKRQGLRIDLVLGTEQVRTRVVEARVVRDFRKKREGRTPSDHAPVVIELA